MDILKVLSRELSLIPSGVLRLFFPSHCIFCSSLIEEGPYHEFCPVCAERELNCSGLRSEIEGLEDCRSLFRYNELNRDLIHIMKFGRRRTMAEDFARLLHERFDDYVRSFDVIIPVPLGRGRYFERGFNQAAVIARRLGALCGVSCNSGLVHRAKETLALSTLGGVHERGLMIKGAFAVDSNCAKKYSGARILLLDDVITTGSTIRELKSSIESAVGQGSCFSAISPVRAGD